ncbi:DUF308 domain-containing protein [Pendulispora brunnea]|uniref:DUF308 domain-containing protein n=1 Tax=Pendulispora brunnea TaxID=2905690 RepID=A0ABZ2JZI0_9BACT
MTAARNYPENAMKNAPVRRDSTSSSSPWLKTYYFIRAAVSIGWIATALAIGKNVPTLSAILLVAYPAWDAIANFLDAHKSGGLRANVSQTLNLVISVITAICVAVALGVSMNAVITVFGGWAILSGLFQLATGIRRRKSAGAQWPMVLSGAQSALAGASFFKMAAAATPPSIVAIAPYAAFGAFYFLVSALWLTFKKVRPHTAALPG